MRQTVSSNPVYLFFASPPTLAGTVLRLGFATALLYGTYFEPTPVFEDSSRAEVAELAITTTVQFTRDVACSILAGALILGFLTRLAGVILVGAILFMASLDMQLIPSGEATHIVTTSAALALALLGSGLFSIDRKISRFLLPSVG